MLTHLHIRNFAIVDELELELGPGMIVLTGETGAGKSILLDALGLALGDRADSALLRTDCDRAEVSVTFDTTGTPGVSSWLAERELEADGECIIRRTLGADGRSRAYVNGQPVPIQGLKELGEQLVDIHGQHAHQSLLRRDEQRNLLDTFAGHGDLLATVAETSHRWHELTREYQGLQRAAQERDERLDLLRFQVAELEALALGEGEVDALEEEHRRLANASRLLEGGRESLELLYEGEEISALALLNRALGNLRELEAFDSAFRPMADLLDGARIQIDEGSASLRHYLADAELDPGRLAWVEERIAAVQTLARKHRTAPEELPARTEQLQAELGSLESADARIDGLRDALAHVEKEYARAAEKLTESRTRAADRLASAVTTNMCDLGMKEGVFQVELSPQQDPEPARFGNERVEFLVSANPGQPPRPLSRVASGGELSRISLAIQVITADREGIPTLVFDEVDVGVGGGVAERVGIKLRQLGGHRQVLCVTHQPQVAALGNHHFRITKRVTNGTTRTQVAVVEGEQRVEELARMLGGIEMTDSTLQHAREMMERSQKKAVKGKKK